jgi:Pyruvate/2-oxoacid:ferredoxin oxidoreductase gamma subunit
MVIFKINNNKLFRMRDTKNLKIGITLGLRSNDESIWTNGMKLNVLIFLKMLKRSTQNYEVCILNTSNIDFSKKASYLDGIDIYYFNDKYMEMDLIICMGAQVEEEALEKFKKKGDKKVITYKCGNNYIISTENILFKPSEEKIFQYERTFDEVWYIPQQHDTNYGFYRTLYRTNAVMVPFVWDSEFLHGSLIEIEQGYKDGRYKKGYKYNTDKKEKVLGILEPNLNIVKFALIPTMIAEQAYRTRIGKERIEKLLITNSENIANHKEFLSYIKVFDLYQDKKIFAEKRYQTGYIVTQFIDVIISHQLLNPLNYLYLDAAYMGYPVLHNASLCKDVGYYYDNCDTVDGAKKLNYILSEHDKNLDEYDYRNKQALLRYSAQNEELIANYDTLIKNLFNGGNTEMRYDAEKNLCFKQY